MEWFEELVPRLLSSLPGPAPRNHTLNRLGALAAIIGSKRFKKRDLREVKRAFHTELNQYIASGNIPTNRKHTEEILHHHRRIDELALLSMLPLDAESRRQVAGAIGDERVALGDSYYAWVEHILDRWGHSMRRT